MMIMKETRTGNIFLVGPMGAGKTSVGRFLAKKLNKLFYDSDEEIEKRTGVNLHWLVDIEGMEGYRARELAILDELSQRNNVVLSTGGGCVETAKVREILKSRGLVIYMEVLLPTQVKRLKKDKKRPQLQNDDKEEVLTKLWEDRGNYYEQITDFTVLTDNQSVQDVVKSIVSWIKKNKEDK